MQSNNVTGFFFAVAETGSELIQDGTVPFDIGDFRLFAVFDGICFCRDVQTEDIYVALQQVKIIIDSYHRRSGKSKGRPDIQRLPPK